jgi:hypothetical protein
MVCHLLPADTLDFRAGKIKVTGDFVVFCTAGRIRSSFRFKTSRIGDLELPPAAAFSFLFAVLSEIDVPVPKSWPDSNAVCEPSERAEDFIELEDEGRAT